jgi:HSP20 family protein
MRYAILTEGHENLGHLARHMTDIMHKVLQSGFTTGPKPPDWTPAVDVCETDDRYEIIVELAGVRREDIEVFTESRHLTVAGWRKDPTPHEKVKLHQMEIEQGQFRRRVLLPPDADDEAITARYRDGLLHVRVPKRKAAGT